MTWQDITFLVVLGWGVGFMVGAFAVHWSHETNAEKRRRGAYTAHNPTPLNALELQAPEAEALAEGEV